MSRYTQPPRDAQPLLEQIGTAAIEWDAARREVLRLKKERNALTCENADTDHDYESACWLQRVGPDGEWMPLALRCPPCQQSNAAHSQVKKAIAACGGKLQRLRRLLAKTQPHLDVQPPDREIA